MKKPIRLIVSGKITPPTEEDIELWQRFTENVEPLEYSISDQTLKKQSPRPTKSLRSSGKKKPSPKSSEHSAKPRPKKGTVSVEATLDLHGLTQDQSHQHINSFIRAAHFQRKRCVLIITGKGTKDSDDKLWWEERGVLRVLVPQWLESSPNKERIQSYSPAHPKHGGQGALYVFLKHTKS